MEVVAGEKLQLPKWLDNTALIVRIPIGIQGGWPKTAIGDSHRPHGSEQVQLAMLPTWGAAVP